MRALLIFLVTFIVLASGIATFAGSYNAECLGRNSINLGPDQALVTSGLREVDTVLLKLRMIDRIDRPRIGMFGNHVVQMMTKHAVLDAVGETSGFFNFAVPHVSAEEMIEYLTYIETRGKLPKYVFIGITDPNLGRTNILGYQWRMHGDIYSVGKSLPDLTTKQGLDVLMAKLDRWFIDHIDFQSVLHALSNAASDVCSAGLRYAVPDGNNGHFKMVTATEGAKQGRSSLLPASIAHLLSTYLPYDEASLQGWLGDGSLMDNMPLVPMKVYKVEYNEATVMKPDDAERIAAALQRQAEVVRRAGGEPIFFLVPHYQLASDRSPAELVMANALRLAGNLHFLDTRNMIPDAGIYYDPTHPSDEFFRHLLLQAVAKGWLPAKTEISG